MERKSQRGPFVLLGLLFIALVALSFWHTSLSFGEFRPDDAATAVVLWGVFTLVVLGVFALGFILFRHLVKLYVEHRQNRPGSKIKTKLVGGALIVSVVPTVCMIIFSWTVMSRTFDKWFGDHTREIRESSEAISNELSRVMREKTTADALWIASTPAAAKIFQPGPPVGDARAILREMAERLHAQYVGLLAEGETSPAVDVINGEAISGDVDWKLPKAEDGLTALSGVQGDLVWAAAPVVVEGRRLGRAVVLWKIPDEIQARRALMEDRFQDYQALQASWRELKYLNLALMSLITVFVLFVAVWLSLFLSRQISRPIEALIEATAAVSSGRLDHRIQTPAIDEFGWLIKNFNEMTQRLEEQTAALRNSNRNLEAANREIDERRRFINAILESITPAVISLNAAGEILKANSSAARIFGGAAPPATIEDLFGGEDLVELRYMLKRAARIGTATREFEIERRGQILHLTATVSALDGPARDRAAGPTRFVIVVEDATELLRAQKSAAWNEVARRVAHEIKNPLTPIALSAERMARLLDRLEAPLDEDERRGLRERFERATRTINQEVQSLRRLVDEFSRLARFPTATPRPASLNAAVEDAMRVFEGRLDDVRLRVRTAPGLPDAMIDPEQFKRVVVNLVDNAAEALRDCWVREIEVSTAVSAMPDRLELVVADSGPGISAEDKEKLFLPYFSTKNRGTGLGLAIINRVVAEHGGAIRVEDNRPSGSRFIVEIPTAETPVGVKA